MSPDSPLAGFALTLFLVSTLVGIPLVLILVPILEDHEQDPSGTLLTLLGRLGLTFGTLAALGWLWWVAAT